jgi:hypothetical protein
LGAIVRILAALLLASCSHGIGAGSIEHGGLIDNDTPRLQTLRFSIDAGQWR